MGAALLGPSTMGLKEGAKRIPKQIVRRANRVETSLAEEKRGEGEPENFTALSIERQQHTPQKISRTSLVRTTLRQMYQCDHKTSEVVIFLYLDTR